jgi:hypothetical protein
MTLIMMEDYDAIRTLSSSMFLGIMSAKYGWNASILHSYVTEFPIIAHNDNQFSSRETNIPFLWLKAAKLHNYM